MVGLIGARLAVSGGDETKSARANGISTGPWKCEPN